MNQLLDSLNKMKDMQIVRFFSQFFTQDRLSPLFAQFKAGAATRSYGDIAKEFVIWAIVLAIGAFIIDQIFYWTSPGQLEQAKDNWHSFTGGVSSLGSNTKYLYQKTRSLIHKKQETTSGRR